MKIKLFTISLLLFASIVKAQVKDINNNQIIKLIENNVPIVDIRRPAEWKDTGVITGSYLLTFFDKKGNYDFEEWLIKFKKIAKEGDPVIIICRSGRRSSAVSKLLNEQANYKNVYNASGGILSWISSKNKIVMPN
jgi:rhodanese-related sulfurtransferase